MLGTVLTRVAGTCSGILASVITARTLGPGGRGAYYYLVMLGGLATQFATLGQQASATYEVAKNRALWPSLVTNSAWISVVIGALATGAVVLVAGGEREHAIPETALLWIGIYVPSSIFIQLVSGILVGMRRIATYNSAQLALSMVTLLGFCVAGVGPRTVNAFFAAFSLSHLIIAITLLVVLLRGGRLPFRFDADVFLSGLVFAAKTFAVGVLGFLVTRVNVFLLEYMKPAPELGYYSLGMQLFDAISLIPASIALVLFPRLVGSNSAWKDTLRNVYLVALILVVLCAAAFEIVTPMIRAVFGTAFLPARSAMLLLFPGAICIGITTIFSQYMAANGLPRSVLAAWAAAAVVAASSGAFLIPEYGAAGAACALSLTYFISALMMGGLSYAKARDLTIRDTAIVRP